MPRSAHVEEAPIACMGRIDATTIIILRRAYTCVKAFSGNISIGRGRGAYSYTIVVEASSGFLRD